ncbi:hypothetical protein CEP53_011770 [Fusarium sp. AF-6]|nr:hypothetical protein CEP53_011770 [Fusarium sp. AF-6]
MFNYRDADAAPQAQSGAAGGRGNKRPRTAAMYQRKRAVTACQSCRLRKTKCDNLRPSCGFCSKNGAQCIYPGPETSDYSTFDPASLTILDRLNHVVTLLESRPLAVIAQPSDISQQVSGAPMSVNFPTSSAPSTEATTNLPEMDILQTLDIPDFPSSVINCESILRWPIFEGLVPDVHSFILESAKEDSGQVESTRTSSLGRGVQEDDFIPLSKKFLAYVHVKNPILDVADYKAQVKDAAENGPRWDGPSCLVLRLEIPLPPSGISHCDYPDMFPSPPTELASPTAQNPVLDNLQDDIVPEEEKSWFYYLAEISYRRMMNRAIAVMARDGERGWINNIGDTIKQCKDFSEHIDIWHSHIPPQIDLKDDEMSNNDLAQFVKNRELSCREWIHRPLLFYVIHQSPSDPHYDEALPLAQKCLQITVKHLLRTFGHNRHHGTWYVARSCMTRALTLLAAAKSGKLPLPEGWKEALEMARWTIHRWSTEAPDLQWAEQVLDNILRSIERDSM